MVLQPLQTVLWKSTYILFYYWVQLTFVSAKPIVFYYYYCNILLLCRKSYVLESPVVEWLWSNSFDRKWFSCVAPDASTYEKQILQLKVFSLINYFLDNVWIAKRGTSLKDFCQFTEKRDAISTFWLVEEFLELYVQNSTSK